VSIESIRGFFGRIRGLGGLLRPLTRGGMQAALEIRESGDMIFLDLEKDPVEISSRATTGEATVAMAASAPEIHDVLIGRLSLIDGIVQRRLLTKGGMCHLIAFFPLFGLTPVLYAEHLRLEGARRPGGLRRALAAFFGFFFGLFAFLGGVLLRRHSATELEAALQALSKGAGRFAPDVEVRKPAVRERAGEHTLDTPHTSTWSRAGRAILRGVFFLVGWKLSLIKYKLGIPIDLFRVLGRLSSGLSPAGDGGRRRA